MDWEMSLFSVLFVVARKARTKILSCFWGCIFSRRWELGLIQTVFDWGRRGKVWFWPDIWWTVKGLIKKWETIAVTIGGSVVSEKNPFLVFLLLPGFPLLRGREGIITLFCRGEHQESGVKIITSFHLRLIFFPAFFLSSSWRFVGRSPIWNWPWIVQLQMQTKR